MQLYTRDISNTRNKLNIKRNSLYNNSRQRIQFCVIIPCQILLNLLNRNIFIQIKKKKRNIIDISNLFERKFILRLFTENLNLENSIYRKRYIITKKDFSKIRGIINKDPNRRTINLNTENNRR